MFDTIFAVTQPLQANRRVSGNDKSDGKEDDLPMSPSPRTLIGAGHSNPSSLTEFVLGYLFVAARSRLALGAVRLRIFCDGEVSVNTLHQRSAQNRGKSRSECNLPKR